jgi:acetyl esterase
VFPFIEARPRRSEHDQPKRNILSKTTSPDERYRGYAGELALRIHRPAAGALTAVVVLFHGGGFVGGSPDAIAPLAAAMAVRLDLAVATPGYTLASECPFPAAVEDA